MKTIGTSSRCGLQISEPAVEDSEPDTEEPLGNRGGRREPCPQPRTECGLGVQCVVDHRLGFTDNAVKVGLVFEAFGVDLVNRLGA